jgi:hypothetical protein
MLPANFECFVIGITFSTQSFLAFCAPYFGKFYGVPLATEKFPTSLVKINAFCERHSMKRNEFYCTLHEEPMCAICVANDRKNCDTIVTIEKAAGD